MMSKRFSALSLVVMLAGTSAIALAGSTGPTNPDNDAGKAPGMEKGQRNTDGESNNPKGTSPGTKGMDTMPNKQDGMRGQSPDSSQKSMDSDDDDQDDDDDSAP